MLFRICAWCGKFMGFRKMSIRYFLMNVLTLNWRGLLTHGICKDCRIRLEAEIKESRDNKEI